MRLFVAVWPPSEVLDALAALDRPARSGVRWTTREQWHVTLRFLGRVEAVDSVTARLGEVGARWSGAGSSWVGSSPAAGAGSSPAVGSPGAPAVGAPGAEAGSSGPGSTAVAGPHTARLGRSLVVLPVGGLDRLAGAVVDLTASFGEPPDPRPFAGHITLARAKRGVTLGGLVGAPLSARWPVTEVTLVESDLHPTGARYSVVARCALR